jgi:hypothetical protein
MKDEACCRAQALSSHNIEELRAFLKAKANGSVPQPAMYTIGGIVRAVFHELCELRKRRYTLKGVSAQVPNPQPDWIKLKEGVERDASDDFGKPGEF